MADILIVDDEKSIRKTLREILEYEGYKVQEAQDGMEAVTMVKDGGYDCVLMDIKMPKLDGMEALEKILQHSADTPVIMVSGHGTIDTAVEAVKKGAFDFVAKPMDLNRLLITVRNALDKNSLITQTKVLKRKVTKTREILGASPAIKKIQQKIDKVAPTDARVLITGENGTGKELVARWIHEKSNRSKGPMVEVNCAAIPSELIESELFGHEKGAIRLFVYPARHQFFAGETVTVVNPFVGTAGDVHVIIADAVGRIVSHTALDNAALLHVSTNGVQSGVYVMSLEANGERFTRRLAVTR